MSRYKIDFDAAEREYVTGDSSYRDLARKWGISFGRLAEYGRKNDWDGKRRGYRSSVHETAVANFREQAITEREEMLGEALKLIRATFFEYARQLKAGTMVVTPKDLATLIEKAQVLFGEPSSRSEATILGVNINADSTNLDLDVLRELERVARAKLVEGGVAGTPQLRTSGSRPN